MARMIVGLVNIDQQINADKNSIDSLLAEAEAIKDNPDAYLPKHQTLAVA